MTNLTPLLLVIILTSIFDENVQNCSTIIILYDKSNTQLHKP